MATITKSRARKLPGNVMDNVPYGNVSAAQYTMETSDTGAVVDSNSDAAVAIGDKVVLGVINGGSRLIDALAIVSSAFTALSTMSIGFEYVDGVDDAGVPQAADYFFSDLNSASAARSNGNNAASVPVTLPKDAFLTVTVAGAALAGAGKIDIVVTSSMVGRP